MARDPKTVSYNMSRIKCKDTGIEVILRKELWKRGLHYRKNVTKVFGKPDIAFVSKKIAIFCDSEFWHGYDWAHKKDDFKNRQDYWLPKIERNMKRDCEVNAHLKNEGWTVLRFWGNDIKKNTAACADEIETVWKEKQLHNSAQSV